ncbi:hypothetical protein [Prescottella subtropica]|uniref:hypothetical protein n=1 Tax=Prescottella subtropica TaxID=2545757 RepID=UPI0010F628E4|nr:hypothetical protein [Prescottella subtropica]
MVFEVKATHRVVSTGEAACEVHPDVFVAEGGRVFVNAEVVADVCSSAAVRPVDEAGCVFVVDDAATAQAVQWIQVLSGRQSAWMDMFDSVRHGESTAVSDPFRLPNPDDLREARRGDERTVQIEVRATHQGKSSKRPACEIYPDVFVPCRPGSAFSRLAGMAMQQPGDIVEALPPEERSWLVVDGLEGSADWISVSARFRGPSDRERRAARRAARAEKRP